MSNNEINYVREAFETNWVAPVGENITAFEQAIKDYLSIPHAVALTTGTAALHLALINLGVQTDDEVIVSSYTFSASVNPILYQQATPVFIDCEKETWNMDPVLLEDAIEDRLKQGKKPKAIVLVHVYGMPAKVDEIFSIASRYDIPVIEDAAESLGSRYKGRSVGTFGEMGVLSFNGNKIITTSNGGALISHNEQYIRKSLHLSTQARENEPYYEHKEVGFNYRLSNILAGIGRGQMEVVDDRIQKRRDNFQFYKEQLSEFDFFEFLEEPEGHFSNYWLSTCLISDHHVNRDLLMAQLADFNIETRPVWKPMHLQPVFSDFPKYVNGTSENLFERGICLPSSSNLSPEQQGFIIEKIKKIMHLA